MSSASVNVAAPSVLNAGVVNVGIRPVHVYAKPVVVELAPGEVAVAAAGGTDDGRFGTSYQRIAAAIAGTSSTPPVEE